MSYFMMFAKAFGKMKSSEWTEMSSGVKGMSQIASMGGFMGAVAIPVVSRVKDQIQTTVSGLLEPLMNEIYAFIGDILQQDGVMDSIENLANMVGTFLINVVKLQAFQNIINTVESSIMQALKIIQLLDDLGVIDALAIALGTVDELVRAITVGIEALIELVKQTQYSPWPFGIGTPIPGQRQIIM